MGTGKRTHVVLPEQLLRDIDSVVGPRQRGRFITEAAEEKLMRCRQLQAIEAASGSWKDEDHSELKQGSAKWVRKLRQESERRLKRETSR